MKYVTKHYLVHCIVVLVCIVISVLANVQGTMFTKTLIDSYIMPLLTAPDPDFSSLAHAILRGGGILRDRRGGHLYLLQADDQCKPGNDEAAADRCVYPYGESAHPVF